MLRPTRAWEADCYGVWDRFLLADSRAVGTALALGERPGEPFDGDSTLFSPPSKALRIRFAYLFGADAANHHPDVDLRPDGMTVRLTTTTEDHSFWLSERDVVLARQISGVARELGVAAHPSAVQSVQITIALVHPEVMPFWRAVLGYRQVGDEDLLDPRSEGPPIWFQQMDAPRAQRNRIHIDVWVPHDQAEARIAAAIAAGGHLVSDEYAPAWWTLTDAEGNEADVATWMGRD